MAIPKNKIQAILIQLDGLVHSNGAVVAQIGLLNEDTGLAFKRILRKIQKELFAEQTQYQIDIAEVEKLEDEDKKKIEIERLRTETFELKSEMASFSHIEAIQSKFNYDFELLEYIAK